MASKKYKHLSDLKQKYRKVPEYMAKEYDYEVSLTPEYEELFKKVDIVFNVNRRGEYMKGYQYSKAKNVFCQCDTKVIDEFRACVVNCGRCFKENNLPKEAIKDLTTGGKKPEGTNESLMTFLNKV